MLDKETLSRRPDPKRGIYCNRTLNMNSIKAVGYDMDYTLIHYSFEKWERHAYIHLKRKLQKMGLPVEDLEFDPSVVMRGLTIDIEHGNVLKTNRFGFVKRAAHGTKLIPFAKQQEVYARTITMLSDSRFQFLNTLFSLSMGCMYAQLVDKLDEKQLPPEASYASLFHLVRKAIDEAHIEGLLKSEIFDNREEFVDLEPQIPQSLLDQKIAGKKLLLITNSDWDYTAPMMKYTFDRFLPEKMTWRELFDIVIVSARKPAFFTTTLPAFEIVNEDGFLKPVVGGLKEARAYVGGCAKLLEELFGLDGEEFLYVGDHVFADVHVSKDILRWRTALILRELEEEIACTEQFAEKQAALDALMREKEEIENEMNFIRLILARSQAGLQKVEKEEKKRLKEEQSSLKSYYFTIDSKISALADEYNRLMNNRWGLIMRAGNDKSQFARQVEQYADIYMSRVSNFMYVTPFCYLRSQRSSLPHG